MIVFNCIPASDTSTHQPLVRVEPPGQCKPETHVQLEAQLEQPGRSQKPRISDPIDTASQAQSGPTALRSTSLATTGTRTQTEQHQLGRPTISPAADSDASASSDVQSDAAGNFAQDRSDSAAAASEADGPANADLAPDARESSHIWGDHAPSFASGLLSWQALGNHSP